MHALKNIKNSNEKKTARKNTLRCFKTHAGVPTKHSYPYQGIYLLTSLKNTINLITTSCYIAQLQCYVHVSLTEMQVDTITHFKQAIVFRGGII